MKLLPWILVSVVLVVGCRRSHEASRGTNPSFPAANSPGSAEVTDTRCASITQWNEKLTISPFESVDIVEVPGRPDLIAAVCSYKYWRSDFALFGFENNSVAWQATLRDYPDEGSIRSLRVLQLSGFDNPVFEIYGMTSKGNGSFYLFELIERSLVLLLKTRAVDCHDDGSVFENEQLNVEYRHLDLDGRVDIVLSGVVLESDDDEQVESKRYRCQKFFQWDDTKGCYMENPRFREGCREAEED